jgi:hypothetical protein
VSFAGRLAVGTALLMVGAAAGSGGTLLWLKYDRRHEEKKPPERWEATVYLPTADNKDSPFTQKDWDEAVGLLVNEFEGATLGAEVEGLWRGPDGKLEREKVRPVVVSFDTHRLADFRRVLDEVGRRLKQEAVYARFERPRVELRRTGGTPDGAGGGR